MVHLGLKSFCCNRLRERESYGDVTIVNAPLPPINPSNQSSAYHPNHLTHPNNSSQPDHFTFEKITPTNNKSTSKSSSPTRSPSCGDHHAFPGKHALLKSSTREQLSAVNAGIADVPLSAIPGLTSSQDLTKSTELDENWEEQVITHLIPSFSSVDEILPF